MPPPAPLPAVFLDRDGVIIENRPDYVRSLDQVQFIPGALDALARLAAQPVAIVIVTNQSAVGRGLLDLPAAEAINQYVAQRIRAAGGRVDGVFMCPHAPWEACACRKPAPGLLQQAAAALGLDLPASVMIGDAVSDVQAGQAVGARPVLVLTGRGLAQALRLAAAGLGQVPIAADLPAALGLFWPALFTKTPPGEGGAASEAILP